MNTHDPIESGPETRSSTSSEADKALRENEKRFHTIFDSVTDVVMPEMNGRDLARNVLSLFPDLKRLFMSGYTADVIARHGVLEDGVHFIQKPFSIQVLAAKVREALER